MAPCVKWTANAHVLRNNTPAAKAGYYLTPRAPASQEESSDSQRKHSSTRNWQINALKMAHRWALCCSSHMPRYHSLTPLASQLKTRSGWHWKLRCFPHFMGPIQVRCGTRREVPVNCQSTFLSKIALGTLQKESMGLSHRWQQQDLTLSQSSVSAFISFFYHACCPRFIHWALR